MEALICRLVGLHRRVFGAVESLAEPWFLGALARFVFGSVLLVFFLNSAATKVGSGFPDILIPTVGAYAQILPPIAEAAGYDPAQIAFFPWKIIVLAGTYSEFLIPLMVFVGLFTRLASLAMLGFIMVMSFVDVNFHKLHADSIGAMFDRVHDAIIFDQRLLWVFPLIYLVVKGAGPVSLDWVLARLSAKGRS